MISLYIENAKNKLTKEEAKAVNNRLIPQGSVLLSCAGSLGEVAITKKKIYANQQFYGLIPNLSEVLPEYLAFNLKLRPKWFFEKISGKATISFFSKQTAMQIEVTVPTMEKQENFADFVQKVTMLHSRLSNSKRLKEECFNSLLQRAFRGEL